MWKVSCKSWWWRSSSQQQRQRQQQYNTTSSIVTLSSFPRFLSAQSSTVRPRLVHTVGGGSRSSSSIISANIRRNCQFYSKLKTTPVVTSVNIYNNNNNTILYRNFHRLPLNSLNLVSHLRLLNSSSSSSINVSHRGGGGLLTSLRKGDGKLLLTNIIKNHLYTRTSLFVTSCSNNSAPTTGSTTPTTTTTNTTGVGKVKFGGGERRLTSSYPFPLPGSSEDISSSRLVGGRGGGGGLRVNLDGTVVERQEDETIWRQELRAWDRGRRTRFESTVVAMGTRVSPGSSPRSRISTAEIASIAQNFLGKDRFSTRLSLSHNFGQKFQDIISLFLFKVAHIDHPLLHITKIVEAEPSQSLRDDVKNPYPLWRTMMILLTTEMYGFPQDIADAPDEVIRTIKEKHNKVAKIAEVSWIAHQLHRRIIDISEIPSSSRLSSLYPSSNNNNNSNSLLKAGGPTEEELHKSNKAATLIGDLLLTQMCAHMAALKSPLVTELVCTALSDFCESEFELGVKPCHHRQFNYDAWLRRSEQDLGSLIGHCLYSALLFSGYDVATLRRAFKLGSLLGILYQAYDDISFFNRDDLTSPSWLDVGILPVVYQIQRNPEFVSKSHAEIFHAIKSPNNSVMDQSMETFFFLQDLVLKELTSYDDVESITARDILINFIHSLTPVQPTSI